MSVDEWRSYAMLTLAHNEEELPRLLASRLVDACDRVTELEEDLTESEGHRASREVELNDLLRRSEARVAELEAAERKMNSALQGISDMAEDFGAPPCSVPNHVMAENMRAKMVDIHSRLVDMYGDDSEHLGQPYGDGFDAILAGLQGATIIPDEDESKEGGT